MSLSPNTFWTVSKSTSWNCPNSPADCDEVAGAVPNLGSHAPAIGAPVTALASPERSAAVRRPAFIGALVPDVLRALILGVAARVVVVGWWL